MGFRVYVKRDPVLSSFRVARYRLARGCIRGVPFETKERNGAREKDEAVFAVVTARDIHAHVMHTSLPQAATRTFHARLAAFGYPDDYTTGRSSSFSWQTNLPRAGDDKNYYQAQSSPFLVFNGSTRRSELLRLRCGPL